MSKTRQVIVYGLGKERRVVDLCDTEETLKKMPVRQLREKIADRFGMKAGKLNAENVWGQTYKSLNSGVFTCIKYST